MIKNREKTAAARGRSASPCNQTFQMWKRTPSCRMSLCSSAYDPQMWCGCEIERKQRVGSSDVFCASRSCSRCWDERIQSSANEASKRALKAALLIKICRIHVSFSRRYTVNYSACGGTGTQDLIKQTSEQNSTRFALEKKVNCYRQKYQTNPIFVIISCLLHFYFKFINTLILYLKKSFIYGARINRRRKKKLFLF